MRFLAVAFAALRLLPAAASAHPLGNFSVSHLAEVDVQRGHIDVRYIVDAVEIPTLQGTDPRSTCSPTNSSWPRTTWSCPTASTCGL